MGLIKSIWNFFNPKTEPIQEIAKPEIPKIQAEMKPAPTKAKPEIPKIQADMKPAPTKANPESARIRRTVEKLAIQVGIDFGTSSTKIAYRQFGETKEVVPVIFGHHLASYPEYCMPSVAAYNNKGQLLLGEKAAKYIENRPWDEGLRRFKMLVAGLYDEAYGEEDTRNSYFEYLENTKQAGDTFHPIYLTITYLVYIMQLTRKKIQEKNPNNELDLSFNVGIPVDQREKNAVFNAFQRILAVAEILEKDVDTPDNIFQKAPSLFKEAIYDKRTTRIFAIPEAVAVIAPYTTSTRSREGIHVLIDFGSGTTDVSILNIKNKELTVWYAAKHIPRGMHKVERIITKEIKAHMSEKDLVRLIQSPAKWNQHLSGQVKNEITTLWKETHRAWSLAYKNNRIQSNWSADNVQIYTCGGGAQMRFIGEIFRKGGGLFNENPQFLLNYPVETMPIPDNYLNNTRVPFSRICLAYGLTTPEPELGEYTLPANAPDDTPPPLPVFEHPNPYHEQDVG